jgi:PEP-CTERM motif
VACILLGSIGGQKGWGESVRKLIIRSIAVLAAAWLGSAANAALITQLPNQGNAFFSDSDCDAYLCSSGSRSAAEDFVLASSVAGIGQVTLWGGFYPNNLLNTSIPFTVRILGESGGLPDIGSVFYSASGLTGTLTSTGTSLFGYDEYQAILSIDSGPLAAGTYFIEIFANSSPSTETWFWEVGNLDLAAGIMGRAYAGETPGSSWYRGTVTNMALILEEGSSVPEPATLGLLGLGLAGLGWSRHKASTLGS